MVTLKGFMIPGLYLQSDHCVYLYNWTDSSAPVKRMTEVWIIGPDYKKTCFIDPKEGISFFNKYHSFDNVIESRIDIVENCNNFNISVHENGINRLQIEINAKISFENRIINFLLKSKNKEKLVKKGKTETGKEFINLPSKIMQITNVKAVLDSVNLGKLIKPRRMIKIGSSEISVKPIINYCTHNLEE